MRFSEERARLNTMLNAGKLTWRQYHAGMAFVSEAARQIVATRDRYRRDQRPDDDPSCATRSRASSPRTRTGDRRTSGQNTASS